MDFFKNKFTQKLTRNIAISIFFVFYLIIFVYLFLNKGIYLNGHFYKKSANLTQITNSAASLNAEFEQITLEKYIDKSIISIDNKHSVTILNPESTNPVITTDTVLEGINADWVSIARQDAERMRRFGNKPWYLVVLVYVLFFAAKKYNVQLYTFFHRNKAAGEAYYKAFDTIFTVFCMIALIYLIIPF